MSDIVFGFITAFLTVLLATPSLIRVAKMKHLVDDPGEERKVHRKSVPTIGGILIFAGTVFAFALWFPSEEKFTELSNYSPLSALTEFKYIVASLIILFFIGVKDDIVGVSPTKKLMAHFLVAFILVLMAEIKITGFDGLFGIDYDLPIWASLIFSMFTYIVVVNAINLIDGIDGLAGGIGFITSAIFAAWFLAVGNFPMALLAVGLAGSLLGFLFFNFNPARIFMGDSGSLTVGLILYVLAANLIETEANIVPAFLQGMHPAILALAILVYPLFDTLRAFTTRAIAGKSPFEADKNHLHHKLLERGFSHKQTCLTWYAYTVFMVLIAYFTKSLNPTISLVIVAAVAVLLPQFIFLIPKKNVLT